MPLRWLADPADLPPVPGAYILRLDLTRSVPLPPRRFAGELAAGRYLYFGNAWGPGGIRSRCIRHFRKAKKLHWHVDWLMDGVERPLAAAFPDMNECDLVHRALAWDEAFVPVPGFGSSDCRRCPAHLLALEGEWSPGLIESLYQ